MSQQDPQHRTAHSQNYWLHLVTPQYSWDSNSFSEASSSSSSYRKDRSEHHSSGPKVMGIAKEDGVIGFGGLEYNFDSEDKSESENSDLDSIDFQHDNLDGVGQTKERIAAAIVEDLLARVRNVGAAVVAPDSVHHALRFMNGRRSITPPSFSVPLGDSLPLLNKRAIDTLQSRGAAPKSVQEAHDIIRGVESGPMAQVMVNDRIDASVSSIGTSAAGGPRDAPSAPLQEPFSVFLPPPYRILFLVALGLLCWSTNLRGVRRLGLDAEGMVTGHTKHRVLPSHRREEDAISSFNRPQVSLNSVDTPSNSGEESHGASLGVYFKDPGPQEEAGFALGLVCIFWTALCWAAYRLYAFHTILFAGDAIGGFATARGRHAQAMQAIAVLGAIAVFLWPGDVMYKKQRKAFAKCLLRVCVPSLRQRIHFPDVLLADILTSFARVFGDLWLTMIFLWPKSDMHVWWNGKGSVAVPLLVSLPYFIRFRQCLSEYAVSKAPAGQPKPLKPLANACKYASAFPVIWLSVLQSDATSNVTKNGKEETSTLFYMWVLSVFTNSLFSFWWDVTNDWGLEMLKWEPWTSTSTQVMRGVRTLHKRGLSSLPVGFTNGPSASFHRGHASNGTANADARRSPPPSNVNGNAHLRPHSMMGGSHAHQSHSQGHSHSHHRDGSTFLRAPAYVMLFPPIVYQLAVVGDLILRFAWSLKLSSHLHHIIELESTAFYLEAMEILRRFVWTFLRLEWEACKRKAWMSEGSMESLTLSTLRQPSNTAAS